MESNNMEKASIESENMERHSVESNHMIACNLENGRAEGQGMSNGMRKNAPYFLGMALIYSICFAAAFYRNYIGITFPLITAATLLVCLLFLKKNDIPWKKSNWLYIVTCLLLGISTVCTANAFVVFFNTVGILLMITVFMVRQMYDDKSWNFGQYVLNLLFLYLNMIPELAAPFIHWINYRKEHKREGKKKQNQKVKYILLGVLIGLPMLLIVVELLSSADQIFSQVIGKMSHRLFGQIIFSPNVFLVILLMILGFFGIYSFLSALSLNNMPQYKSCGTKKNPLTAITFISMVTVVYVIFCGIQVLFLFTGGMLLPEAYTYAEYAHQGFFQLLFVCLFNLVLVGVSITLFDVNRVLKLLLLLCSGCTYIMLASSAFRMILYISTYHLSFLRVLVLWFLAMLSVLLAGVVITVVNRKFKLFRYCMVVVAVFYLVFSFGRVDVLVAEYNIAQMGEDISFNDLEYLAGLSVDAVPALSRYRFEHQGCGQGAANYVKKYDYYTSPGDWFYGNREGEVPDGCRRCLLNKTLHHVLEDTEHMGVRTFHLSRYLARRAAVEYWN